MLDLFKSLYLEYLGEIIQHGDNRRPRVRNIEMWKKIEPILAHGTEVDVTEFIRQQIAFEKVGQDFKNVWTWSDQHFGHKNIIRFSNRPYPNLELMRECMVLNYNELVRPDDICIWVGDVAFLNDTKANEIVDRCMGYKILIVGNHDIEKKKIKKLNFDEIHLIKHIEMGELDFVFTHYPVKNFPLPFFNIHGHEHVAHTYTNTIQHFNVNCEFHGYRPLNMRDIYKMAKTRRESMEL